MGAIWSAYYQDDPHSALIVWAIAVSIFWETVFSTRISWHLAFLTLPALHSVASSTWRVLVSKLPTLLDAVAVSLMMMKVMSVVSQSWTVQSTFCVTHVHSAKRAVNFAADSRTLPSVALHTCPRHLLWSSTWFYPCCSSRSFSSCTIDLLSTGIVPKDTSSNKSATTPVI